MYTNAECGFTDKISDRDIAYKKSYTLHIVAVSRTHAMLSKELLPWKLYLPKGFTRIIL